MGVACPWKLVPNKNFYVYDSFPFFFISSSVATFSGVSRQPRCCTGPASGYPPPADQAASGARGPSSGRSGPLPGASGLPLGRTLRGETDGQRDPTAAGPGSCGHASSSHAPRFADSQLREQQPPSSVQTICNRQRQRGGVCPVAVETNGTP